ncbi:hypothetical protein N7492_001062 [Penicillium capsulatum]|uniref:Polyprenal reductase n=1 Tax=Penicillium capsulatum TaxID=69766 RepID=A0A9W9LZ32_9EURO|nr:hypothetical protein N7492_001062 [Penicillium capsulatum]KAJ6129880.1 hypothetical protein N7512_002660 [Penicillium capsulatum]
MDRIAFGVDSALEAAGMDAVDALRAFFILAAATTISVSIPSFLRDRFLVYGPRATSPGPGRDASGLLDYLATWRVPHRYFTQFYIASLLSSGFWAVQILCRGGALQAIAERVNEEHQSQSMSLSQVIVCWILLAIQGSRRLWESWAFAKPSSSQMGVVHWLLGLAFYLAVGVAIWIEGSGSILAHPVTLHDFRITIAPSFRTFVFVPLFLVASGIQHDCHHFLFSLKKYTVPDHPIFRAAICPHYGAECIIYLLLAILAAPSGQVVNKTLLACLGFVAANLGVTAQTTKQWYKQKFGAEAVPSRWLMIPYIY